MSEKAASLRLLDEYIRIPTISGEIDEDTVKAVVDFWHRLGLEFELLWPEKAVADSIRNPALFASVPSDQPNAPTLLLYGHWDVQPTGDPAQWLWQGELCPPFQPTYFLENYPTAHNANEVLTIVPTDKLDELKLVARGSADNKGQHLANILGVLRAKRAGQLAWTVKIILDGEEEVGSPNLASIVETHRARLKADFMVGSDGPKSDNRPTILLGVRGIMLVKVRCSNGTGRMLHSGNYGNITPNPVLPLARLLEQMSAAIKLVGQDLGQPFRQTIDRYFKNDPERPRYEPFLAPTFNINSLLTEGATAGQSRTIIPGWAEATIDVRLIPGLTRQIAFDTLQALVKSANQKQAEVNFSLEMSSGGCEASFTAPDREGFAWLRRNVEQFWGDDIQLLPLLGGTLPNDVFTDKLKMASYWLPAANSDNRQHDTNEHFILGHYFRQQDFYAALVSNPPE